MSFLAGGGEMGELIRAFDWARNPLGPPAQWRPTLKAMVRMALTTRHPIFIFWGPELICFYNDSYRASLGAEKHPSILGIRAEDAWPEIWHIIGPQIEMVLRGDGATWNENQLVPIVRHGGLQEVYWTYSYGPIDDPDAQNGVGGVLVICTETTQQVLAERRHAYESERFHELFVQAPTFMAVLRGANHRFEMANPSYLRVVGNRAVVGKTVAEALPEAVEQGYLSVLDEVYRTGEAFIAQSARFTLPSLNGGPDEERFLDFVYQPMRDTTGRVTGIFVEGVDVTERREAQRRLSDTEDRLRLAIESSALGTFDVNLEQVSVTMSARSRELFDLEHENPTREQVFERVPPDEVAMIRATIERARVQSRQGGDDSYRMRHRVLCRDGHVRWVNVWGRVTRNADGHESLTGVLWDVTEQQQMLDWLQKSDRRKDEFLAVLAHELRNPLAPMRTAAHLLSQPGLAPDRMAECGRIVQRQTQVMALLLDDLLDVSRITTGKLELRRQRVSVQSVVDAAIESVRPAIDEKRHELRTALPDGQPMVDADPLRLAQVLINLLTNAAKYTDAGGCIRLCVREHAGELQIDVSDNGIGIAPELRPQLFEMFHQVKGSLDRSQGGLGIGLALSKGLIELHGGRLEAFSEGAGLGSTFRVSLAAAAPVPAVAAAVAATSPTPTTKRRVLVVDDNIDAAEMMAMVIGLEGHDVKMAHDGLEALALAHEFRPEAAFLDIGMPGLDGYQLATKLREAEWGGQLLLVATTGWGQNDDRQRALEAGFDTHLTKPVAPQDVLRLLREGRVPSPADAGEEFLHPSLKTPTVDAS